MPVGIHSFYAYSIADTHRIPDKEPYFLGRFEGDKFADRRFAAKLEKVIALLAARYGFGGFCCYWSPAEEKPYKPRTAEQRLATALKKAGNKNARRIAEIRNANYLFGDLFMIEEEEKLSKRIDVLKNRYKT